MDDRSKRYYELRNQRKTSDEEDDKKLSSSLDERSARYYDIKKNGSTWPTKSPERNELDPKQETAAERMRERAGYLEGLRSATKNTVFTGNNLRDEEKVQRRTEMEKQLETLREKASHLNTVKQGATMGRMSEIADKYDTELSGVRDQIATLEREMEMLDRPAVVSERDQLAYQLEDAKRAQQELRAEASKYNTLNGYQMAAALAKDNRVGLHGELNDAELAVSKLQKQLGQIDYVNELDGKTYSEVSGADSLSDKFSNFKNQFGANRQLGRLSQDTSEAFNEYLKNPTEENKRYAYAMAELEREFQQKNAGVLDDEGAVLSWISQDAAGYLPQFADQLKAQIGGGVVGGVAGLAVGNPVKGAQLGASVATGIQSYGQMQGAAYRSLLEAGVDEETAREAANDEAFINALIESGLTYATLVFGGAGASGKALVNAAATSGTKNAAVKAVASMLSKKTVDSAAKQAAKEAGKTGLRKAADWVGRIGFNAVSEWAEEGLQEGVSIANQNRENTGVLNLAKEAVGTLTDAITGEDKEALGQIKEAAGAGFRIGLMFGGTGAVMNSVVSNVANAKSNKQRAAIVDAVVEDREVLGALVEEGKASGENTVSAKIAKEIETTLSKGESVTREQVQKLIAANDVYIENEAKTSQQTAKTETKATADADAKKLGYGEHGTAALKKLSEGQEMAIEEVNAQFHLPYLKGLSNTDMKDAGITTPLQRDAFNAGRMDRIANMSKDVAAAKNAPVSSNAGFDYNSPHIPKTMSKATQDVFNDFSVALGTRTTVLEKIAVGDDESGANAMILGDGSIGLSADTDIKNAPSYFFHEGLHRMKQLAPAETRAFINAVVASTVSEGATSSVEAMQNFAAQRNVNLSVDTAMEEIAADRAGEMFGGDANRAQAILRDVMGEIENEAKKSGKTDTEAKAHARNVVQKFIDAIRSVIQSLKDYLSKNKAGMSKESRSDFEAAIQNLTAEEKLWKDALKAAVKTAQEKVESGNQQAYTGDNETKYAAKYWRPDLTQTEWSLLNKTLEQELTSDKNYIDEATKWLYAKEKGAEVFAVYGIGDGTEATVLFAEGTKHARADSLIIDEFARRYAINGADRTAEGISRRIKSLRRAEGRSRNRNADAQNGGAAVVDGGLSGGRGAQSSQQRGSNEASADNRADGKVNLTPTDDPDVRFSMKKPVEETKDLLALHNLTEKNLRGVLRLGGLPMPSIAVVKAEAGHSKYGPISMVFSKDTIDPKASSKNKVYGGDAYTPTDPGVYYPMDRDIERNFDSMVWEASQKFAGGEFKQSSPLGSLGYNGETRDDVDEIAGRLARQEAVQAAYLSEQGKTLEPVMSEKVSDEDQFGNDALQAYINRVGEDALIDKFFDKTENNGKVIYPVELSESEAQDVREALKEKWRSSFLVGKPNQEELLEKRAQRVDDWRAAKFVMNAWNFYVAGGYHAQEIDHDATKKAMWEMIAPSGERDKVEAVVKKWAQSQLEGLLGEPGVYNGKSAFTPSGNRRAFWQRHDPYTLENIVKAMKNNQQERGGNTFGISAGSLQATATPSYKSIAEIKADSERLGAVDTETYRAKEEAVNKQIDDIIAKIKGGDMRFGDRDYIGGVLKEAAEGKKTVDAIVRKFKAEGYDISNQTAKEIQALYKAAAELPTEYFEAKPQRAVGFDEVLAVVVPNDLDVELREQLAQTGVNVLEFKAGDDTDRLRVINTVEDARFSMKGQSDLLKENAKLKEVNEALREQFKTTKFAQVDKKSLDAFAKKLLQDYQSGADINETRDALNDLYTYMANGEDGQTPAWNDVQRRAYDAAVSILEGASTVNDDLYQEYKQLRNRLRNYGMTISEEYNHDIAGYESINEFRKANFGRIKLVKNGTPVDVVYADLADTYPEFFDPYEYTTQADQLTHIAEVLDSLQPYEVNPYSYNMRESATWLANDIIERFYDLPQAKPTFADKAQQKLTKQVIRDAKKLERVRDQKNERIAKLIESNREKVKNTQTKERAKRAEAVAKVRDHYEAKEAKASDRRKASLWRKKISKHVNTISKMLLKGNDNSHVPEEMRGVVGEFLAAIDLSTPRQKAETREALRDLQALYKKIADNETEINIEVDPDLQANMDEVLNALRRGKDTVSVTDLNNRELEALYRVLLAVERSIYMHNKAMVAGKTAEISELARGVMMENATDKAYTEHNRYAQFAADMVNMEMLNPQDYFIQLGGTMNDLFQSIRDGFDTKIRHLAEAQKYMNQLLDGADVKTMSDKKAATKEFKTKGGQAIRLTPAQVMSLYLLQRQPDALGHIYEGGIKPAPVVALDGKSRRPKVQRAYEVVKVTPEDVANILDSMTPEQKKIAEGIGQFFTEYTAKWGNEVSLALYGYKKFTVENYFPIVSDQNYLKDVFGETNDATLKNMGSTKARIKGANNPIIIEDVFDVFSRQADSMSSYNAFVIPLSDIQRVYNFKTTNGSVKQAIEKKFGVKATQYFKKLMTDVNGGGRWNGGSQLMNEMISRYKQAKLGLNLRVIVQQPTAMLRAQAVMDSKYIAKAMTAKSSVDMDTIFKYAPIAQWKDWGFFSMDTGKQMKDIILDTKQLSDYTMWAAGKMDEITWKRLWVAAEMEIRDKHSELERGSEEYLQAVGKRFSEVIDRTQVVDSVLHRSQIMRNPDTLVKMSVSFMNEPFKAYNMVRTAVVQAKNNPSKAAKQALLAAGTAYLSTLVVNHLITAVIDTYRGDEDDEEWLEKMFHKVIGKDDEEDKEPKTWWQRYWWHFADNAVNEPLSMFPVVKDVVSLVQGYDVKRMDMQGLGDFVNAAKRGLSDKYTIQQKIIDIGSKLGDLFGIPASSLKREIESLAKLGVGAAGNPLITYKLDKMFYTVTGNKSRYLDILYEAYKQGDMAAYQEIAQDMIDEGIEPSSIESGMKSRAKKDSYIAGYLDKDSFTAGIELKLPTDKQDEDKFTLDDLTSAQYTRYAQEHGALLEDIIGDFERRGFGRLDAETANSLLSAAYTFAEETVLESASGGAYESDKEWIGHAKEADELGMTTSEYLWARGTHDASITADGVYKAYEAGVDVEDYLTFRDMVNDLESGTDYEKGDSAGRRAAIIALLNSIPGLTQDEYDYMLGTEYKNKSGFGSSFGGSFGSSFGSDFGTKFGK